MCVRNRAAVIVFSGIVAVTVLGIVSTATLLFRVTRQHKAVQAIVTAEGNVYYDYQVDPMGDPLPNEDARPSPFAAILGKDLPHTPVRAEIGHPFGSRFRSGIRDCHFDRAIWADVEQLQGLQWIGLSGTDVADNELLRLRCLPKLRGLDLADTGIGDTGLESICELGRLEHLCLVGTKVSDAGLRNLKRLDHLQYLFLSDTSITDTGLAYLRAVPTLKHVSLSGTKVTENGVRDFRRAMPSAFVLH